MTGRGDNEKAPVRLKPHGHTFAAFEGEGERLSALVTSFKGALDAGRKILWIVEHQSVGTFSRALRPSGVDADDLRMEGRLRLVPPADAGRSSHFFDDARLMANGTAAEGFSGLHLILEMSHIFPHEKCERAVEFERKLDRFCRSHDVTALCLYDRAIFDPRVMLDAMAFHPSAAVGGMPFENHRYCDPAAEAGSGDAGAELSRRLDELLGIAQERRSLDMARGALAAALESAEGCAMLAGPDGSIAMANSRALDRFFKDRSGDGHGSPQLLLPKKVAKAIRDRLEEATGSGKQVPVEFGDDGEILAGKVVPVLLLGGSPCGGVVHLKGASGARAGSRDTVQKGQAPAGRGEESKHWQGVIDAMSDSVCVLDAHQVITHCNRATETLVGMSGAEILGKHCWEVFHGGTGPVSNCPVTRCKATLERDSIQFEMAGRWMEIVANPITDGAGAFLGAVHICKDVTEQRSYEDSLRRERDLSSGIIHTVPVGVAVLDHDGKISYANEYAAQKLGLKREPAGGGIYSPAGRDGNSDGAANTAGEHLPFQVIRETLRPVFGHRIEIAAEGGRRLFLSVNAAPVLDSKGGFDGMIASVEDISDRVVAEESMHIKDRAIEASITGIAIADASGKLNYINPSFLTMWGYGSEMQVLGRKAHEFWETPSQADLVMEGLLERGSWIGEMVAVRRDRSTFSAQISASIVRDESGNPVCMMASFVDISERREFDRKLKEQTSFLETTIEALTHPFYVIDASTYEVKMANSAAKSSWAKGGTTCFSAAYGRTTPCRAQGAQCPLDEVKRTGAAVRVEHLRYAADGSTRIFEVHGYPIFGPKRDVVQMIEYSIDITERKKAEEELRASEIRNRTMLRAIPDLVFVLSRDGVFLDYQAKGEEELLLKPQEFLGRTIGSVFQGDVGRKVQENFGELLRGGGVKAFDLEFPVAGETRYYDARMIALDSSRILALLRDISERKRAEEALQREKDFVEKLIETANAMVVGLDLSGGITIFNEAAAKITGYSPEELKGKNWFEILVPKDRYPYVWEKFKLARDAGFPRSFENPILAKSGEERYIVWKNSPVFERGVVSGTISFGIDITERKMAETALRLSEERFRRTFAHAPIGAAIVGLDHRFQSANAAFCEIVGYTEGQLRGMKFADITHPDDLPGNIAGIGRLLDGEIEVYTAEKRYIRSDGRTVWASISVRLLRDESGSPVHLLPMVSDITDKKKVEMALREREAQLEAIFQNSQDAIGISKDGIHTFANRAYLDMFGYGDNAELEGKPIINRVVPSQRAMIAEFGKNRTAGEPAPSYYESRAIRKDGSEFDLQVKASAVVLGGETHIIAVMRDVTGQKHRLAPLTLPLPGGKPSPEEVGRRVMESLDSISGILEMGDAPTAGKKGTRLGLAGCRVRSAAAIQGRLACMGRQEKADAGEFVRDISGDLADLHMGKGGGASLDIEVEPVSLDPKALLPLGMILSELLGFLMSGWPPPDGKPEIGIKLRRDDGEFASLAVERRDTPKPGRKKAGPGELDYAKALAAKLGGTVRLYTAKCKRAVLTFNLSGKKAAGGPA